MRIRLVRSEDTPALLAIYGQYIDTPVTFEYVLPSLEEFTSRVESIAGFYPFLVCEDRDTVVGYAYASRLKDRQAYQWNAELSVYIDSSCTGSGLGKRFYRTLMDILKSQNILSVYGCVTVPNAASEALHESLGFTLAGKWRASGYKNNAWHDVAWYVKHLAPHRVPPPEIQPIGDLPRDVLETMLIEE